MAKRKKKKNQEDQGYTLSRQDITGLQLTYLQACNLQTAFDALTLAEDGESEELVNALMMGIVFASRALEIPLKQVRRTFINAKGYLGDPNILIEMDEDIDTMLESIEEEKDEEDQPVYAIAIPENIEADLRETINLLTPIVDAFTKPQKIFVK